MAHQVCNSFGHWVSDEVSQPLQKCVEQDCDWWCACCNKWFCAIVWVLVQVVSWVVETICELVADVIDLLVALILLIVNIVVGIFTLDPDRIFDAFVAFGAAFVALFTDYLRAVTFVSLVGKFRDAANLWTLENYVSDLIDGHDGYTDEQRGKIKDAMGITGSGGFGFRLMVVVLRGFVRSDRVTLAGGPPDLVRWHNDPDSTTRVDLKVLAGFDSTSASQRARYELIGDGGARITEDDIDTYLANPTAPDTTQFRINCMTADNLSAKLTVAKVKGGDLGLKLELGTDDVELTRADLAMPGASIEGINKFLTGPPFQRKFNGGKTPDLTGAVRDLCAPLAVATFLFQPNSYTGYSAHLAESICLDDDHPFAADGLTGVAFRDRVPDFVFKYVLIHELGHTFGLCHADGIDRIMYSAKEKSWWDTSVLPEYALKGEPGFTLDEAKRVWKYIIDNFSPECLSHRQH